MLQESDTGTKNSSLLFDGYNA